MPELTWEQKARINLKYARIYRRAFGELRREVDAANRLDILQEAAQDVKSEMDQQIDGIFVDGDRGAPWRCLGDDCHLAIGHEGNCQ